MCLELLIFRDPINKVDFNFMHRKRELRKKSLPPIVVSDTLKNKSNRTQTKEQGNLSPRGGAGTYQGLKTEQGVSAFQKDRGAPAPAEGRTRAWKPQPHPPRSRSLMSGRFAARGTSVRTPTAREAPPQLVTAAGPAPPPQAASAEVKPCARYRQLRGGNGELTARAWPRGSPSARGSARQGPSLTSRAFSCPTSPAPAGLAVPLSSSPSPLTWLWAAMRWVFEVLFTSSIFMAGHPSPARPPATRGPRVTKAPGARPSCPAPSRHWPV